jgi:predicted GNAT superfamily acetyltransferase
VARQAWELAHRAAAAAGVELRPLRTLDDCDAIIRVMTATWGEGQSVPREMIRALADSGNVPHGAFAGQELIGFVLGWTGVDEREGPHVHSHMLAALPDRRHRGVGYALKLAQRADALERGIALARWTFDPLVARNAYFNLHKLGAVADRFERNFYGEMTDALNSDDRSDRLLVRWALDREPGPRSVGRPAGDDVVLRREDERPRVVGRPSGSLAVVEVPPEHRELRERDPALAISWRDAVAEALEACLGRGMVALAFDRERSAYVFAPPSADAGTA